MLTAFVTTAPSSAAATCSATITPARSCASSVEAARCGVTTTLSRSSSGPEYGSSEKTSSAAAATLPERSASTSASSSTSSPRAALIRRAPSGSLVDRLAAQVALRLLGERKVQGHELGGGKRLVLGLGALDAELAEALLGDERVVRDDAHPEAERAARDLLPDAPEPEDDERLPSSSTPPHAERSQMPCLSAACACGMLRARAASSPIVCSAAEVTVDSGAFATTIPRLVAAATSTLSTPTPARPITLRRSARSIRSPVSFVAERITIAS